MPDAEGQTPVSAGGRHDVAVIAAIAATMIFASAMNFTIAVLAPFLQRDMGVSVLQIGVLSAAIYVVASPMSTVAGRIADRLRARRACLLMTGLAAAGFGFLAAAPNYPLMLVAVAFAGGAMALSNPTTNNIIVDAFPVGRRGAALGWKQAGVPLAAMLAGGIAPSVASAWGWRATVAGIALFTFFVGGLSSIVLRVVEGDRHSRSPRPIQMRFDAQRPVLRGLNALGFLMGVSAGCLNTYLVLYAVDALAYEVQVAGFVAAVAGLSGAVLRVIWPVFAERRSGPVASLRIMAPLSVAAVLVVAIAPATAAWLVWIGAVLTGAGITVFNSLGMLAVLQEVPASTVGVVTGALSRAFFAGLLLGPLGFGFVVDTTGSYGWAWALVGAFAVAATAVTQAPAFLAPLTAPALATTDVTERRAHER